MHKLSASALHQQFISGEVSATSIAEHFLKRIASYNRDLGAFLSVFEKRALAKAALLDDKKMRGKPLGSLAGVPIAVKDNIHVCDEITTCGSEFLRNYTAPFSATVVEELEREGAIILGKLNLDEFGMGSSSEHSAFYPVKNPWDHSRSPGGSSGGSSAAAAARLSPITLGTDTGGSIRQPASFTGTFGFKPTYGRVSRYGLVAFGSSFDVIGPFANSVEDIAMTMEVMARPCANDATSIQKTPESYRDHLNTSIQGKVIGVPWNFLEGCTSCELDFFRQNIETYTSLGAVIKPVDLSLLKQAIPVYYILSTAEASTNLARFDGIRYGVRSTKAKTLDETYTLSKSEGFGPEVKQRILLGTHVLSSGHQDEYFRQAQKVRTLLTNAFCKAFDECDIIALPTTPNEAFPLDSIHDPLAMYLQDLFTVGPSLAGLPSISIPAGLSQNNLPLGLQLVGAHLDDAKVLNFAHQFTQASEFHPKMPTSYE